jgi:hypothetical protein
MMNFNIKYALKGVICLIINSKTVILNSNTVSLRNEPETGNLHTC